MKFAIVPVEATQTMLNAGSGGVPFCSEFNAGNLIAGNVFDRMVRAQPPLPEASVERLAEWLAAQFGDDLLGLKEKYPKVYNEYMTNALAAIAALLGE